MIFSRQPAGVALGALGGTYPVPAFGLPPAAGPCMFDDFTPDHGAKAKSLYGELDWDENPIGSAMVLTATTPTSWEEVGVLQAATVATAGRGGTLTQGSVAPLYRLPPPGSIWAVKLRLTSGTVNYELWSGFASVADGRVQTADSTQFVGVRSNGGNLFGVFKSNGGIEATVDLGVTAEGTTWRSVGFEVQGTTSAPTIQFFLLNQSASEREVWDRTDIGAPLSGITITAGLIPVALGILTTSATAKTAQIDYWAWGGRIAR
jgi:hypothetical protein